MYGKCIYNKQLLKPRNRQEQQQSTNKCAIKSLEVKCSTQLEIVLRITIVVRCFEFVWQRRATYVSHEISLNKYKTKWQHIQCIRPTIMAGAGNWVCYFAAFRRKWHTKNGRNRKVVSFRTNNRNRQKYICRVCMYVDGKT